MLLYGQGMIFRGLLNIIGQRGPISHRKCSMQKLLSSAKEASRCTILIALLRLRIRLRR